MTAAGVTGAAGEAPAPARFALLAAERGVFAGVAGAAGSAPASVRAFVTAAAAAFAAFASACGVELRSAPMTALFPAPAPGFGVVAAGAAPAGAPIFAAVGVARRQGSR